MTTPDSGRLLRLWRRLYVGASLAWAGAVPAATIAAAERLGGVVSVLTVLVYGIGSLLCHQRPERSFHIASTPFPVCARCVGLYLGAAWASSWSGFRLLPPQVSSRWGRAWLVAAAAPVVGTLIYEWSTGSVPSNLVRAASGLPLGGGVTWLILSAIDGDLESAKSVARVESIRSE